MLLNIQSRDAFCTLFVARLAYDTSEKKLRREFEQYGAIKSLRLITDREVSTSYSC
jgi:U1 small nuclear ribonucleoprotein 70kDa